MSLGCLGPHFFPALHPNSPSIPLRFGPAFFVQRPTPVGSRVLCCLVSKKPTSLSDSLSPKMLWAQLTKMSLLSARHLLRGSFPLRCPRIAARGG